MAHIGDQLRPSYTFVHPLSYTYVWIYENGVEKFN